jgi:hypothetical protein
LFSKINVEIHGYRIDAVDATSDYEDCIDHNYSESECEAAFPVGWAAYTFYDIDECYEDSGTSAEQCDEAFPDEYYEGDDGEDYEDYEDYDSDYTGDPSEDFYSYDDCWAAAGTTQEECLEAFPEGPSDDYEDSSCLNCDSDVTVNALGANAQAPLLAASLDLEHPRVGGEIDVTDAFSAPRLTALVPPWVVWPAIAVLLIGQIALALYSGFRVADSIPAAPGIIQALAGLLVGLIWALVIAALVAVAHIDVAAGITEGVVSFSSGITTGSAFGLPFLFAGLAGLLGASLRARNPR